MSSTAMLKLKQQLSALTQKDQKEAADFLRRLKENSPAWQKEMTRRMTEMDKGKKFRLPKPPVHA